MSSSGKLSQISTRKNRLINGAFRIHQRAPLDTAVVTVDNTYLVQDRWRILIDGSGTAPFLYTSSAFVHAGGTLRSAAIQSAGGTHKIGLFQVIEALDCTELRGSSVSLQFWVYAQASFTDIRAVVLEFSGTADAVSGDPVTTWGASGAGITTYGTNWTARNTPVNLNVPAATDTLIKIENIPLSTSFNNLAVLIWSNTTTTTNADFLAFIDVQLEQGVLCTEFERTSLAQDLLMCQRYYEKSYDLGTAPGSTTTNGLVGGSVLNSGATNVHPVVSFKTRKRVSPSVALYGESGSANQFYSINTGADASVISVFMIGETGMVVASGATASESAMFHYTASAEL